MLVRYSDPGGGKNTVRLPETIQILKNHHTNRFGMVTPIVSSKYRLLYQFYYVTIFSTNQYGNLVLLDDPGRVRSQITNVVCQIQRFDFDCNLVVTRKVLI